ncbi:LysE family translocator [Thalassotalea marina]|uniref:RhtB family transporter n=1 Tax=Thalassotalea marina TaxID=1673741 RepID=A0A919EPL0_9GAMM|nr:LysE family translocator [Thalassotalea marina]GHG06772.1 RhtB family transporter [Thalassotalea marina]
MDNFLLFTLTSILLVLTPGPGNVLAIARGISQGKRAAIVSSIFSGLGVLMHVLFATLGLSAILITSAYAFTVVKIVGAIYLVYLGIQAIRSQSFVSFEKKQAASMNQVALAGFLTASLSPKIGVFMLAFIPQFISHNTTNVGLEMAVLGTWFAFLTGLGFALMGVFAYQLKGYLVNRPKLVKALNHGAGTALVGSGISLAMAKQ